jgi:transmembrane sensor
VSEVVKLRTRAEIEEEAALWIWRMDSGTPPGDADPRAFETWLRQDPRHRRAVDELSKAWSALDGLAEVQRSENRALSIDAVPRHAAIHSRHFWRIAVAAVLVAGVASILWLRKGSEVQTLATAVGQHRNVTLADGTIVALNTNTIVETNLSPAEREIFLRKGEAHFDVAPDRSRPFLVHAGDAVIRAVGTEFGVRVRADQHVDVLVDEGRVEVRPDASVAPPQAIAGQGTPRAVPTARAVSAGEQLSTATADYAVVSISAEQVSSELAWREGAVVFDTQPLSEAIAEIQRYTDARIVITDPRIAALPVGGRFKTDDLQGFLDGLQAALPLTIHRAADGVVYVDPRG